MCTNVLSTPAESNMSAPDERASKKKAERFTINFEARVHLHHTHRHMRRHSNERFCDQLKGDTKPASGTPVQFVSLCV